MHGLKRRSSSFNTGRVDHLYEDLHTSGARFILHYADLHDGSSLAFLLEEIRPDEIYNLGAQSHVKVSFEVPEYTSDVVALGTLRVLEAIRRKGMRCRFYQASSSEMFGNTPAPQSEASPFHPRSPYACAKVFAHQITVNYRESYGLHASAASSSTMNPRGAGKRSSPARSRGPWRASSWGLQQKALSREPRCAPRLGFRRRLREAMWLMLQQDTPDDYVIGTGEAHRCGNSPKPPSRMRGWTGTITS